MEKFEKLLNSQEVHYKLDDHDMQTDEIFDKDNTFKTVTVAGNLK
jgi:hypothetical protein